jgi:SAM-dependent methyltransferase
VDVPRRGVRYQDYDPFAAVYDQHWGSIGPRYLGLLEKHVLERVPRGARILDLCCGNGKLAGVLVDRGYQVSGLDGSSEMLRYAQIHAPGAEFVLGDAREFSFERAFRAVVSTSDSLNHLMTLGDLCSAFRCVHRALEPGGVFAFDMNTEVKYATTWSGTHAIVEEDRVGVFRASASLPERIARMDVTLFERRAHWERCDFGLVQTWFLREVVCSALTDTGFESVSQIALGRGADRLETADCVLFVASKPEAPTRSEDIV